MGAPPFDADLSLKSSVALILPGKTIRGCNYGSVDIVRDIPTFCDSYQRGQLLLDELVSQKVELEDINDVMSDMESGEHARSVNVYD